MFKEFRAFVLRGNVLDLAVGVVIGAAFGKIVNGVVDGILDPLVALAGDVGFKDLAFTIGTRTAGKEIVPNDFQYGLILDALVNFILVAAAVFFLVVKPVNHLMARMKTEEPVARETRDCPECFSSIPKVARRCAFCTAEVATR